MIQRIQSIFLLLAGASGFGVLALPFATTAESVQGTAFSDNAFSTADNIGLLVLFALSGALAVADIFLFNNRKLQIKIGQIALLVNVLGIVLAGVLYWQAQAGLGSSQPNVAAGFGLPIAFFAFVALAIRSIKKDEALVRSADRLR
jgi:Domain of unknown function (DUF4293)